MIVISSSSVTLWLVILTLVSYGLAVIFQYRQQERCTGISIGMAWILHGATLVAGFLGDIPRFGFGSALSVTAWLMLTIYGIEYLLLPRFRPHWALAIFCGLAMVLGAIFPGNAIEDRQSPWMAVHMALGIASYGLFATAVAHGWLMQRAERQMRLATEPEMTIPLLSQERLVFRFTTAGFVLLSATLLAGLLFGEQVYGHAWQWRHKQVFAVLAWVTFAILLLARWHRGIRGKQAMRILNVGALFLLLSYVGSRFVMEVLLGGV